MGTDTELWTEYLEIINNMVSSPGMYHLDSLRTKIHEELSQYYIEIWDNFIPERFDAVCHSLECIIDFNPPLEPYDHIKPYVSELILRFSYQDLKKYCTGFINKLRCIKEK